MQKYIKIYKKFIELKKIILFGVLLIKPLIYFVNKKISKKNLFKILLRI